MTYSQVWCRALASGPGFGCSCWVMAPALQFLLQSKGTESVLFKKKKKKCMAAKMQMRCLGTVTSGEC